MISTELRNQKPYTLPVQCIPYIGLKEADIRMLVNKLVTDMVALGMNVAGTHIIKLIYSLTSIYTGKIRHCTVSHNYVHVGFVTDGKFNYLRTKGYTRPLSVLQIHSDVKRKYSKIKEKCLLSMLTPKCKLFVHAILAIYSSHSYSSLLYIYLYYCNSTCKLCLYFANSTCPK